MSEPSHGEDRPRTARQAIRDFFSIVVVGGGLGAVFGVVVYYWQGWNRVPPGMDGGQSLLDSVGLFALAFAALPLIVGVRELVKYGPLRFALRLIRGE